MCGLCGTLSFAGVDLDAAVIERMTRTLAHRGPDAHHTWSQGDVHLGHRRLSVVDLGAHADQPMSDADGDLWIVFNGEIYDHERQRRRLEGLGRRFRTRSDTEVILQLYAERGDDCVESLHGMFAFALWDRRQRRLLLARDRLGKKPLYYHAGREHFVFASEIKALLVHPAVGRDLDPASLHAFLSFDYVPGPGTVFAAVQQLPPGHLMVVDESGLHLSRYWQPSYRARRQGLDLDVVGRGILDRLTESIRLRLMSDVPLGVFLSGGIDSSALVALLRGISDAPIHTFALGFAEPDRDERPYARQVADAFGTEHREFAYESDVADELPGVVAHYDQPFGDPSMLPLWELARRAREHVTVVLTGEGGDETFAGYDRYVKNALATYWYRVPRGLRRGVAAVFDRLFGGSAHDSFTKRLQQFFAAGDLPPEDLFCRWLLHSDRDLAASLYTEDFRQAAEGRDAAERIRALYRESDAEDPLNALLDVDVRTYLADDLLVKLDMATMRHSLEGRCPYLDQEFFGFVASLPGGLKLRRLTTKWILRRALRSTLPRQILTRRKLGFGPPVQRWLRGSLREMAFDLLNAPRARQRGYFRPETVGRLLDEHSAGRANHGYQLWNLLVLELWHRAAVDR